MPGLALFGVQVEESELEEIELVAQGEGSGSDNEEDARPALECAFPLSFSFVFFYWGVYLGEGGDTSL